ncbi:MAG TPA: hypothetical protein VGK99_01275 [Acidobacteriota bacterium]|jgi:hypothetical protein
MEMLGSKSRLAMITSIIVRYDLGTEGATKIRAAAIDSGLTELAPKFSSLYIHRRFACSKFLRQTFHEHAEQSISQSTWARAFYQLQKAEARAIMQPFGRSLLNGSGLFFTAGKTAPFTTRSSTCRHCVAETHRWSRCGRRVLN